MKLTSCTWMNVLLFLWNNWWRRYTYYACNENYLSHTSVSYIIVYVKHVYTWKEFVIERQSEWMKCYLSLTLFCNSSKQCISVSCFKSFFNKVKGAQVSLKPCGLFSLAYSMQPLWKKGLRNCRIYLFNTFRPILQVNALNTKCKCIKGYIFWLHLNYSIQTSLTHILRFWHGNFLYFLNIISRVT